MQWEELKARLLEAGSARLSGEPAEDYIAKSTAGPGAGGKGAIFFAMGSHRIKFAINPLSSIEIAHRGGGVADLYFGDRQIPAGSSGRGFTVRTKRSSRLRKVASSPAATAPSPGLRRDARPWRRSWIWWNRSGTVSVPFLLPAA